MEPGERLLLACEGGPSSTRLVHWPVPVEIPERGGTYVLDDGAPDPGQWRYVFVPDA